MKNGRIVRMALGALTALSLLGLVAPAPSELAQGAWYGEYLANPALTGAPAFTRYDKTLRFDWGGGSPGGGVPADNFSVGWSGTFPFEGGRYRFTTSSDDGVRVTVDGQRIIDAWMPVRGTRTATVALSGRDHTVQVEYFERLRAAMVRLNVERIGDGAAASTAPPSSTVCEGGRLRLETWPLDRVHTSDGWKVTIYARAYGGDCRYRYAWERGPVSGPTSGPVTFEVKRRGGAMVGEVSVTSAGESVKVGLYVRPPERC